MGMTVSGLPDHSCMLISRNRFCSLSYRDRLAALEMMRVCIATRAWLEQKSGTINVAVPSPVDHDLLRQWRPSKQPICSLRNYSNEHRESNRESRYPVCSPFSARL